jgi:hypothetical protein
MHIWSRVHMLPLFKKHILICKKNSNKNFACTSRHSAYAWPSFTVDRFYSVVSKKTRKKKSRASPYFIIEICLFCVAYRKSRFFVKQLGSCIGCKGVHATFFSIFLTIQNMFKLYLKSREHLHPRAKKPLPYLTLFIHIIVMTNISYTFAFVFSIICADLTREMMLVSHICSR